MNILMAQLNPIIGDLAGNTKQVTDIIENLIFANSANPEFANEPIIELLVTPEAFITGYPPLDLVERDGFIDEQLKYVKKVKKATKGSLFVVALGCITKNEGV